MEELNDYFNKHNLGAYDREKYDRYIKSTRFVFDIPSIHITGTNGKGSTANYLYNIYLSAGYKVGLFTSPYLDSVTEMISVNGKSISEDEYISLFYELKNDFESYQLTSFEMQTIVAFEFFKRNSVDIAIIEVGMGGYIDATNIFNPMLSIISSISLEHTAYLGYSTSEIAFNKAGIIKNGAPVLVSNLDEDALFAIRERAKKQKSDVRICPEIYNEKIIDNKVQFDCRVMHSVYLNTNALYQAKNANLAIEAVKMLEYKYSVSEDSMRQGLLCKNLNCRFEWLNENTIVDGAHNPEAIKNLVDTVKRLNLSSHIHVIFACFRDKHFSSMLNLLDEISDDITITTFDHPRAKTKDEYLLFLETYNFADDYLVKIKEIQSENPADLVLITGGLYFAGLVKRQLLKQ